MRITSLAALILLLAGAAVAQPAQRDRMDPAWLTPDQVHTVLRARGFTDIGRLSREGDTYKITNAVRYGEKVPELTIDALTGQARETPPLTERQARSLLEERGYTAVEEVGREGDLIRLRARHGDTPVVAAICATIAGW